MSAQNPFSGIESPFFWPVGLAIGMEAEAIHSVEKNLKFFEEVVHNDIVRPAPQWATPNKIIYETHTFTLRDFTTQANDTEIPTLVLPPYAGHTSTIADFHPKQSLIETLLENGVTYLYAVEWRSATEEMKDYDIDNYLADLHVAITDLGSRVNLIGLCQGGWMASLYAARFPGNVASLVCAGSPLDTQAGNGDIRALANELPMSFYESLVEAGGGLLKGEFMLAGFKGMHPDQHMINKYISLYEHLDDPEYLKRTEIFESWYENTVNLPGRWYLQAIQQLFKENRFAKGEFVALGRNIKPQAITCPMYLLAGEADDITPPDQVFNAAQIYGTPADQVTKSLAKGGHIGLFMGSHALRENWPFIADWLVTKR